MDNSIIDIANCYMRENDGILPILIIAKNNTEKRILVGKFRDKRVQTDQTMFINAMRVAMILHNYTSYEFVMKPVFDYKELQMTKDVFAVGEVSAESQRSTFYELSNDVLVPYCDEMPIQGYIAQILPSDAERQMSIPEKAKKQLRTYIENCTYVPKEIEVSSNTRSGIDALMKMYS